MSWNNLTMPFAVTTTKVCSNADGSVLIANAGTKLYKSIDGGGSWVELTDAATPLGAGTLKDVEQSPDGKYIVAVGSNAYANTTIWYSDDFGATFNNITGTSTRQAETCALSDDGQTIAVGFQANSPTQSYIYWSINGGSSWTFQGTGQIGNQLLPVAVSGDGTTIMGIYDNGVRDGYQWTTNSGGAWNFWNPAGAGWGFCNGVGCSYDGQVMVAVGNANPSSGGFRISTNGGVGWTASSTLPTTEGRWAFVEVSSDGETIIVGQNDATPNIYRSLDQAASFEDTLWPGGALISVELNGDADNIVASTSTSISRSFAFPVVYTAGAPPRNPDEKRGMLILDYDNDNQWADLLRPTDVNLARSELLNTAVLISLFTRRRARPGDVLPAMNALQEGWWADPYEKIASHRIGSRLWLLRRSKATQSVLNLAREYAIEALQWMIDDGIAQSIEVEVERQSMERLAFKVEILKPDDVAPRWVGTWNAHLAEL